jgi:hypothetical protein
MKNTYIIGIDPSVSQSGIAYYNTQTKQFEKLESLRLWEVFGMMLEYGNQATFIIENSNLNKSNWHGKSARGNVGKNKGISQNIVDYARSISVEFVEVSPKGFSQLYTVNRKYNHLAKKLFEKDTGWTKASNKDQRAACAMVKWAISNGN